MRKDVLSNKIAKLKINNLLKEGYSKGEIAQMANLNNKTIHNIVNSKNELVKLRTHNKIEKLWDELTKVKEAEQLEDGYFLTEDDVIDAEDAEMAVKEVTTWLIVSLITLFILIIVIIGILRYIIGLFS